MRSNLSQLHMFLNLFYFIMVRLILGHRHSQFRNIDIPQITVIKLNLLELVEYSSLSTTKIVFFIDLFGLFSSLVWRNGYRINIWSYLTTPEFQRHIPSPVVLSLEISPMALDFKPWNTKINSRCEIFVCFFLHSFPQNERKIFQFCSVCIFFEGSVFQFSILE